MQNKINRMLGKGTTIRRQDEVFNKEDNIRILQNKGNYGIGMGTCTYCGGRGYEIFIGRGRKPDKMSNCAFCKGTGHILVESHKHNRK